MSIKTTGRATTQFRSAHRIVVVVALTSWCATAFAESTLERGARAVGQELQRYARDARSMAAAPLHWDRQRWQKAGVTALALGSVMVADEEIQDLVQRNRSDFTEDLSDFFTPWGGQRAQWVSAGMIVGGAALGDDRLRDTGRDALEAYIFAGRIVTPLLKVTVGRSRPFTNEGTYAFDPFSDNTSFPSGHATNAFAVASVIAEHYDRPAARMLAYSVASAVAYARVHDNVHFGSDVVAGAIVGTAIGRGVVARNRKLDEETRVVITPLILDRGVGVQVSFRFPGE